MSRPIHKTSRSLLLVLCFILCISNYSVAQTRPSKFEICSLYTSSDIVIIGYFDSYLNAGCGIGGCDVIIKYLTQSILKGDPSCRISMYGDSVPSILSSFPPESFYRDTLVKSLSISSSISTQSNVHDSVKYIKTIWPRKIPSRLKRKNASTIQFSLQEIPKELKVVFLNNKTGSNEVHYYSSKLAKQLSKLKLESKATCI